MNLSKRKFHIKAYKLMEIGGIEILEAFGFEKRLDKIGQYCNKNRWIYYKVSKNKDEYLVFSPNCFDKKLQPQNFDFWMDTYLSIQKIGTSPPIKSKKIKFSFDFCRDIDLLKELLPNRVSRERLKRPGLSLKSIIKKRKSE